MSPQRFFQASAHSRREDGITGMHSVSRAECRIKSLAPLLLLQDCPTGSLGLGKLCATGMESIKCEVLCLN